MSRIAALEDQLKDSKALVERRGQILRLSENADFRAVILNAFFVEEAARYVRESGDPALTDRQRTDALNIAQAAGHLKRFLNVQIQMGNQAEASISDIEQAIDEERALDQDGGPSAQPADYEEIAD